MTGASALRVGIAVAVLVAAAAGTLAGARARVGRDALIAVARASVQLVVVALIIAWVFRTPGAAWIYLAIMLGAATWTSARRIAMGREHWWRIATAIGAGATVTIVAVMASGALPRATESFLPFAAQILGGSMTAVSLAGMRMRDEAASTWPEVEGWLALGATPRIAAGPLARLAVTRALVPAIDQTRNAGLVVLPGAFVGLLLAGASPMEAAQVQLLVLVGLLAAESVAATLITQLLRVPMGTRHPGGATELPRQ